MLDITARVNNNAFYLRAKSTHTEYARLTDLIKPPIRVSLIIFRRYCNAIIIRNDVTLCNDVLAAMDRDGCIFNNLDHFQTETSLF